MELTIPRSSILPALERAAAAADTKSTLPVLTNVLMRATPDSLALTATDLLVSVQIAVNATVAKPGDALVPARALLEAIKVMPEGEVKIVSGKALSVVVYAGKKKLTLIGMPPEDYITIATPPAKLQPIPARTIGTVIDRVRATMATDDTRANMAAMLIEIDGTTLRAVATDGHRLSMAECILPAAGDKFRALVPTKGIEQMRAILSTQGDGNVDIGAQSEAGPVFVRAGSVLFSSKLVDSAFPSYQQVIPAAGGHEARVNRAAMLDALRTVAVVSTDRASGVRIAFGAEGGMLVATDNPDMGDAQEMLDATVTGGTFAFGVNARYIVDALRSVTCDEVSVNTSGELDPMLIRQVGKEAEWCSVVMPMRI